MPRVAVLDTETTGVDPEVARVVTAFFGVLEEDGSVLHGFNWIVRPDGFEIPEEAAAIHGVSTAQALTQGAALSEVVSEIIDKITWASEDLKIPICAHNGSYDFTVLDREIDRAGLAEGIDFWLDGVVILDSFVIDKHIDPYRKGKRTLITAAEHYGVELSEEEAHGAQADAIASGRIIQAMLRQGLADEYGPKALHEAQKTWKREQAKSLQHYFRTKADPPQPDAVVNGDWPYIPRKENQ